jgi:hypothetical protein
MRAYYNGCGMHISLCLQDKNDTTKKKTLKCRVDNGTSLGTELFLHIRKNVPWKAMLEEPGFHVTAKRTRQDVYISDKKWNDLMTIIDPETNGGGYTGTRCAYDRIDITYYPI